MPADNAFPGRRVFLGQLAQTLAQLLLYCLPPPVKVVVLMDALAGSGWLQERTIDDSANEPGPRRQQVALALADKHAADVDVQIAELAYRRHRSRRHKQKAPQGHRQTIVAKVHLAVAQ